ncbi:tetratricopeptide repeat protein [Roseibium denhamense]|uniref:Tetratricopeptide repeat-containing protein n=1 Tax=Roseibium denhamense TaxID=76305 RepID=A0ABY1P9H6_9HYPH|nr:tetratricopeptide repeat protein [Roseibium denhamense]SMP29021.1 Tetratricopeptide repeat-containing protein [Roseibium denhamense]
MKWLPVAAFLAFYPFQCANAVLLDEEETPPKPTPTSTECPDGTAWDPESERCFEVKAGFFDDQEMFRAARELAYAGRLESATLALDSVSDQADPRVLTYRGFIARRSGNWPLAIHYYQAALQIDPNNRPARSYLGMGYAERGQRDAALAQLREIRARGGRDSWPERALLMALRQPGSSAY